MPQKVCSVGDKVFVMETTVNGTITTPDTVTEAGFFSLISNVSNLTAAPEAPNAGASKGGGSTGPQCFYWDFLVRILLNSVFAVLGILGNT